MPTWTRVVPILRMFDEALTKEFYLEFLGAELAFEHRFTPSSPLYMGVRFGANELHLSSHFGDGNPGVVVRIETMDLDAYVESLAAKQYRYSKPGAPIDQTWGCRELTIADPSGNRLTFYLNLPR